MTGDWRTWLTIGAVGFGGPAGQVALLHRELVERRGWLDEGEFLAALRVCMLLPGPEAQQLVTYAGWRRGGIAGGLLAGTLFVLPGAVIVVGLAWLHAAGRSWPLVAAAFAGTRPAVVALVALAAWRIARRSLAAPAAGVILGGALVALAAGVSFPFVVPVAGLLGALALPAMPPAGAAESPAPPLPIDTPRPLRPLGRVLVVIAVATALWAGCLWAVTTTHAAGDRGGAIARLFTTTTLLSLGGAYAAVPWALDESVARGWLDTDERFTALAAGEATPGPLMLVVTFIGFMAGWRGATEAALRSGLEGGAVATVFAFVPSFALIFGMAPFVRAVRPGSWVGRALAGVGAAVVAAVVMLALRLAAAAFVPAGGLDPSAVVVAVAAALTLFTGRAPVAPVMLAAAALGAARSLVGG